MSTSTSELKTKLTENDITINISQVPLFYIEAPNIDPLIDILKKLINLKEFILKQFRDEQIILQTTFHNIPNVKDVDILRINATKNLNVPNMQEPNFLITAHWAKILKKLAA
ncbi:hypothetical protein HZH66_013991 [Vespula vulgaris]|uniref:Uncharacterized protein n=1 Tax=Vespula vulgaris TaxID=7454 RepID=A0A834J6S0_VESVU|nr:hypothetical protein HZH66_013991 [Vespula vulgaris]